MSTTQTLSVRIAHCALNCEIDVLMQLTGLHCMWLLRKATSRFCAFYWPLAQM